MGAERRERALRRTALLAVCLSLGLNVAALFVPFLRVDAALQGAPPGPAPGDQGTVASGP